MDRHANANVTARVFEPTLEPVATGVWLLRGGVPRTMNAYLLQDDGGGVTVFDTGIRAMGPALIAHAGTLGGINRVVLSHAHVDHRGGAPRIGLPVWTHPLERADTEGDAGRHYMHLERFPPVARWIYPRLQDRWDGGPVSVAGTIEEGEEIAGFTVIGLPGHSPGQIGLFRERDGVALAADAFLRVDALTGRPTKPVMPHRAFNHDGQRVRESLRKLAALAPSSAWPGHGDPIRTDVRGELERLAGSA
jgi:glyoxylase-like metal-dependent hydrolase (beta-lactamase superfamily II)